MMNNFS